MTDIRYPQAQSLTNKVQHHSWSVNYVLHPLLPRPRTTRALCALRRRHIRRRHPKVELHDVRLELDQSVSNTRSRVLVPDNASLVFKSAYCIDIKGNLRTCVCRRRRSRGQRGLWAQIPKTPQPGADSRRRWWTACRPFASPRCQTEQTVRTVRRADGREGRRGLDAANPHRLKKKVQGKQEGWTALQ
jgi:hypothetical protein